MKKLLIAVIALLICICFAACTGNSNTQRENENESVVSEIPSPENETTAERVTNTTSPVKEDKKKGEQLSKAVSNFFDNDNDGKVKNDGCGGFSYISQSNEASEMYSMEQSDDITEIAEKNANNFVQEIKDFYPDEITYEQTDIKQIGGGDNGIDSAVYTVIYVNTQNQELKITTDSTGRIYYVSCAFTW